MSVIASRTKSIATAVITAITLLIPGAIPASAQQVVRADTTLSGHGDNVTGIAWSPDGKTIATSSWDRTARIWDVARGKTIHVLRGHGERLTAVAFSADGATVATASMDQTVRLWDVKSGASKSILQGHRMAVNAVSFSSDGQLLASGSMDDSVIVWDFKTGKQLKRLGCGGSVTGVAFSHDKKYIVCTTRGMGSGARITDLASGTKVDLKGHTHDLTGVSTDTSNGWVATSSDDHTVRIWQLPSGRLLHTLTGHREPVAAVAASKRLGLVASAAGGLCVQQGGKIVRLWDATSWKSIATLAGHDRAVLSVAFSPAENKIATGSCDNTVRIWTFGNSDLAARSPKQAESGPSATTVSDRVVCSEGSTHSSEVQIAACTREIESKQYDRVNTGKLYGLRAEAHRRKAAELSLKMTERELVTKPNGTPSDKLANAYQTASLVNCTAAVSDYTEAMSFNPAMMEWYQRQRPYCLDMIGETTKAIYDYTNLINKNSKIRYQSVGSSTQEFEEDRYSFLRKRARLNWKVGNLDAAVTDYVNSLRDVAEIKAIQGRLAEDGTFKGRMSGVAESEFYAAIKVCMQRNCKAAPLW